LGAGGLFDVTTAPPATDPEWAMLNVGDIAPDFALENTRREIVRLSDFRGRKNVVVAFHPLAFTPVCSTQMQTYEQNMPALGALDAVVLGISFDPGPSHAAWANSLGGLSFDLLSDFHPHGQVARAYGAMRDDGLPARAIFVVDKGGRIRWIKFHEIPEQPDFQELSGELRKL
jgi:peroxiredoxin